MSKYICLCGMRFKNKKQVDNHIQLFLSFDKEQRHTVFKQHWASRIKEWFIGLNHDRTFRIIGATLIFYVVIVHFSICFNWNEAALLGLGLGMYIE